MTSASPPNQTVVFQTQKEYYFFAAATTSLRNTDPMEWPPLSRMEKSTITNIVILSHNEFSLKKEIEIL